MMSRNQLTTLLIDHALSLGSMETVTLHEPKSAPGHGVTLASWVVSRTAIQSSGLNSTSVRFESIMRLYKNMLGEPQDTIDDDLADASDALWGAYSGDFDLSGQVRMVDLLGAYGAPLSDKSGYITQDNKLYRVIDVTVPVIINDQFDQAA